MAPVIMGNPDRPELGEELTNSFCRTNPEIAKHFARVTFLSDNRADLPNVKTKALILQCSQDAIAPEVVGRYVHQNLPGSQFVLLQATGHCPNLSAPEETIAAMRSLSARSGLRSRRPHSEHRPRVADRKRRGALRGRPVRLSLATLPDGTIVRANRTFLRWTGLQRRRALRLPALPGQLSLGGRIFYDTHFGPLLRMQGFVNEIAFDLICTNGRKLATLVNTVQRMNSAGRPARSSDHRVRRPRPAPVRARVAPRPAFCRPGDAAELQQLNDPSKRGSRPRSPSG